jgi:sortase A
VSAADLAVAASPARRARPPRRAALLVAGLAVALLGSYLGSNTYASLGQRELEGRLDALLQRAARMDPVDRSSLSYAPGDPIARLVVPAIGLDVVVVEGTTPALMRRGPGHLPGSAVPGEQGVAIVTGNRLGFGGFFQRLDQLQVGDRILVRSALGSTAYTVTERSVVPADRLDLATDSEKRVLVLFASAHLWGGSDRLVIRAVAEEEM